MVYFLATKITRKNPLSALKMVNVFASSKTGGFVPLPALRFSFLFIVKKTIIALIKFAVWASFFLFPSFAFFSFFRDFYIDGATVQFKEIESRDHFFAMGIGGVEKRKPVHDIHVEYLLLIQLQRGF